MWVNDSQEDLSLLQHKSYLFNYTELNTQGSVSGNEEESEIGSKMSSWTKKKANLVHFQKWNMLYQCINLNQQPPTNENKKQREGRWMHIAFIWLIWNLVVKTSTTPELNSCNCVKKRLKWSDICTAVSLQCLKSLKTYLIWWKHNAKLLSALWESFSLCNLICPLLLFFLFCPLILCICMSAPFLNFLCFFYLPCSLHLSHSVSLLHLQLY